MSNYDCSEDVRYHIALVRNKITFFSNYLYEQTALHDVSKLQEPEKSMFDEWTPKLKEAEFGSDEYKLALSNMGEGLKHHYENNRHHPEHFENGIADMNLLDVVEMVCDWVASAEIKGVPVDLEYLSHRFGISDDLKGIIANTLGKLTRK
jgi:hypothetical protein